MTDDTPAVIPWATALRFCPHCAIMLPSDFKKEEICENCGTTIDEPIVGLFSPDKARHLYFTNFS